MSRNCGRCGTPLPEKFYAFICNMCKQNELIEKQTKEIQQSATQSQAPDISARAYIQARERQASELAQLVRDGEVRQAEERRVLAAESKITDLQAYYRGISDFSYKFSKRYIERHGELSEDGSIRNMPKIWDDSPYRYKNLRDNWEEGWFVQFKNTLGDQANGPGYDFMLASAYAAGFNGIKNWDQDLALGRRRDIKGQKIKFFLSWIINDVEFRTEERINWFSICRTRYAGSKPRDANVHIKNGSLMVDLDTCCPFNDPVLNHQYQLGVAEYLATANDSESLKRRRTQLIWARLFQPAQNILFPVIRWLNG